MIVLVILALVYLYLVSEDGFPRDGSLTCSFQTQQLRAKSTVSTAAKPRRGDGINGHT